MNIVGANIRRTWRERLFSWPWKPWQKYRKPGIKGEYFRAANERMRQAATTDAELERRTGEPHVDGWPLYSGLPPAAPAVTPISELIRRHEAIPERAAYLAAARERLAARLEIDDEPASPHIEVGRVFMAPPPEPENQRIRQDSDWSCRADEYSSPSDTSSSSDSSSTSGSD